MTMASKRMMLWTGLLGLFVYLWSLAGTRPLQAAGVRSNSLRAEATTAVSRLPARRKRDNWLKIPA